MDKTQRPLGITALALASVAIGIYSFAAAVALLLGGTVVGVVGADRTAALLFVGALFLGLMAAAFVVGFGFWTQRRWSWTGGIVVFAVLICASVLVAILSGNLLAAILPVGVGIALVYLVRPQTRAWLTSVGTHPAAGPDGVPATDGAPLEASPTTR
jgi:hypothetical protein